LRQVTLAGPQRLEAPAKSGFERIAMDIAGKIQDIGVILNQHAFETALKQMPAAPMPIVEASRIRSGKPMQGPGQIGLPGSDQQMIMVRHRYIGEKLEAKPLAPLSQRLQEQSSIGSGTKDVPALIAAR